jgi:endonuclease/exonuclease/phosphatase family metal-dependent hydrolase
MNSIKTVYISITSFIFLALLIISSCSSGNNNNAESARLNVLTINLLFSEFPDRSSRLEAIADLIAQRHSTNDPIDIILLQEVVGGLLSGTSNSSVDLLNMLSDRSLNYYIFSRLSNGLPAILQEGNAILSRHEIRSTDYARLPKVSEEINEDFQITLRQEIIMARVHVPGFGEVNIYNTHFCAFCDPAGRLEQTRAAMRFIESTESLSGRDTPVILGGDFNIDLNIQDNQLSYDVITNEHGYADTYTPINNCIICCSTDYGYSGCTYAVPGNPYALPLFLGQPIDISRIDYIFTKKASTISSQVIFNDYPWVSDHSGILTKIKRN